MIFYFKITFLFSVFKNQISHQYLYSFILIKILKDFSLEKGNDIFNIVGNLEELATSFVFLLENDIFLKMHREK